MQPDLTHLSGEEPTLFEKIPLDQLLAKTDSTGIIHETPNQLSLFDNLTGH